MEWRRLGGAGAGGKWKLWILPLRPNAGGPTRRRFYPPSRLPAEWHFLIWDANAPPPRPPVIFAAIFCIALTWAAYTGHAWEDYYITYRASKNLATGHGLTFTHGEKVHTFTSPLGVLLPALASLVTANKSDVAALWIFRIMSASALGGAGVLLGCLVRKKFIWGLPAIVLLLLFATDAKSVDFSANGMETGFVLLFLAWTLYALLTHPPRLAVHLGLAWAGLRWSRPDSFVYIGLLCFGAFLFPASSGKGPNRLEFLGTRPRRVDFVGGMPPSREHAPRKRKAAG